MDWPFSEVNLARWTLVISKLFMNYILLVFIEHYCYGASKVRSLIAELSDKIVFLFYCLVLFLSIAEDSLSSDI